MRKEIVVLVSGLFALGLCTAAAAQQDVTADPTHHKLEFENECVRVVRANYGPHEKADAMFDAQAVVIVSLTGSQGFKLSFPDGNSVTTPANYPGQVFWAPKGRIQSENLGDMRVEFIVIEPKGCQ
jgi:hypothetical protein